jgi:hypothetical protein
MKHHGTKIVRIASALAVAATVFAFSCQGLPSAGAKARGPMDAGEILALASSTCF